MLEIVYFERYIITLCYMLVTQENYSPFMYPDETGGTMQKSKPAQTIIHVRPLLLLLLCCVCAAACVAHLDPASVKASALIPEAVRVDRPIVPYDPSLPIWYFAVEPVQVKQLVSESEISVDVAHQRATRDSQGSRLTINSKVYRQYLADRQVQIAAQLNSALLGIKNFRAVDYESAKQSGFRLPKESGATRGVYVIRAIITEYEDRVTENRKTAGVPLLNDSDRFTYTGVVGLDVSVIDPQNSATILDSIPVQGSYTYAQAKTQNQFIGQYTRSFEKAQSTIDQALRVALYNAVQALQSSLSHAL